MSTNKKKATHTRSSRAQEGRSLTRQEAGRLGAAARWGIQSIKTNRKKVEEQLAKRKISTPRHSTSSATRSTASKRTATPRTAAARAAAPKARAHSTLAPFYTEGRWAIEHPQARSTRSKASSAAKSHKSSSSSSSRSTTKAKSSHSHSVASKGRASSSSSRKAAAPKSHANKARGFNGHWTLDERHQVAAKRTKPALRSTSGLRKGALQPKRAAASQRSQHDHRDYQKQERLARLLSQLYGNEILERDFQEIYNELRQRRRNAAPSGRAQVDRRTPLERVRDRDYILELEREARRKNTAKRQRRKSATSQADRDFWDHFKDVELEDDLSYSRPGRR